MGNCFKASKKEKITTEPEPKIVKEPEEKVEEKPDEAPPNEEPVVEEQPIGDATQYAKDMLEKHNKCRAEHATDPMTISVKLCEDAQKWAEHIAANDELEHCGERGGAGENLAWSSADLSAEAAFDMWYNEHDNYDFSNPGFGTNSGHFTQIVWKGSKEFGAGVAQAANGGTYVVGRYLPPGNVGGQFEENVLPKP